MVTRFKRISACGAAFLLGAGAIASAADMPPAPVYKAPPPVVVNPWTIDITPYAWLPSLNGSSTVKGHTSDVDASFFGDLIHREIPKQLFGLMTSFEARNDRFAVIGDFTYLLLGAGKGAAVSKTFGPRVSANVDLDAEVTSKTIIAELAGAYQIARWAGGAPGSGTAVDVYGGGRLWWQQADVSLALSAQLLVVLPKRTFTVSGNRAYASSGDITWIDPIVGLRLRHEFSPGSELTLSGDVGGFGVGSKFSWQALGAYRWTFAKTNNITWSGMLGYRALYVDYTKGSGDSLYTYDMLQHGPIAGVTARF